MSPAEVKFQLDKINRFLTYLERRGIPLRLMVNRGGYKTASLTRVSLTSLKTGHETGSRYFAGEYGRTWLAAVWRLMIRCENRHYEFRETRTSPTKVKGRFPSTFDNFGW